MKYFVITDSADTLTGLRLAGMEGELAHNEAEAAAAIARTASDSEIGILLISESLAALCAAQLHSIRLTARLPLVVEIPDRHSTGRAEGAIPRYIREAIGVKI